MAAKEPAESKADAVTRMVQKARLQTSFFEAHPYLRHTVRNQAAPGSSLREYWEHVRYIGCGGFGSVNLQRCIDVEVLWDDSDYEDQGDDGGATEKIRSLRAVKQLSKPRGQPKLSGELLRELHALVSFTDPKYEYHFATIYGWYENERTLFISMEYFALGDLQSHLEDSGPFKEPDAKFISKQVLRGLEFMHAEDFVHRDLKPSNLLIKQMPPGRPWWVKISDFGLSKKIEKSRALSSTLCGTLGFMAPELLGFSPPQNQPSQLDRWKAADIWAFGETVYRLLTGVSSFGDNIQDLGEYFRGRTDFPRKALERNNVSGDGIEFIRNCMAPYAADRPSANAAIERLGWPVTHGENGYRNMTAKTTWTLSLLRGGKQPPFILFTPDGGYLLVIGARQILVWDIESMTVISNFVGESNDHFCHGSFHPDGEYLCVTQAVRRKLMIIEPAIEPEVYFNMDEDLDGAGNHPTISAFSPDGQTLVTARSDELCQIDIQDGWTVTNLYCVAATTDPNRDKNGNSIKELRFTKDGSKLIVACNTQVVIMQTAGDCWYKKQVIENPCVASLSGLDISPSGNMVACGSTTGELWLWTSAMGSWVRRILPVGGPAATSPPVENVRFSATGMSILYNRRGLSRVNVIRSVPLNYVSFANNLRNHPGRRMGHSITYPDRGIGATALGGDGGASVVFWKYEM